MVKVVMLSRGQGNLINVKIIALNLMLIWYFRLEWYQ